MCLVVILAMFLAPMAFAASPWTEEKTYGGKGHREIGICLTNTASRLDKDILNTQRLFFGRQECVVWRWSRVYRCGRHHGSRCRSVGYLSDSRR